MNTAFLLMAQFDGLAIIPAETVCAHYFPHLKADQFIRKIGAGEIKLPLVRAETSQKSAKGVHLQDLADYLDTQSKAALEDFKIKAGSIPRPILSAEQLITKEFIQNLVRISPNVTGIYFLFSGDECVYVGQSVRMHTRIREHMIGGERQKEFDSYSWFECPVETLNTLETYCISLLEPRQNLKGLKL